MPYCTDHSAIWVASGRPQCNMSSLRPPGKQQCVIHYRLYAKLIYANNRLTAKLILKDIAASTKRLCTAFVYNSQGSNGVQNIISKLFKLLTKGRLAVRYAKTIHKSLKA